MRREEKEQYLAQQKVNAGLSGGVVPHSLQFFLCLLVANKRKGRQRGDRMDRNVRVAKSKSGLKCVRVIRLVKREGFENGR
jgi:hypothetical protein